MPAAIIPFPPATATRSATWSLLEVARPGLAPEPLGILFVDTETNQLLLRLKNEKDFDDLDEEAADYLSALAADIEAKAKEQGGEAVIDSFEASLSGFLRIGDRTQIEYAGDAMQAVNLLYDQHVDDEIRPFLTHLPFYGLRAAATKFGEEFDQAEVSEPDSWIRVPQGLRLTEGMFIAQVVGRSMQPLIPDGAFCVFRAPVTGSRQGRRLLIEQTGGRSDTSDLASRYTVKRYTSRKTGDDEGGWRHETIRLEPLNPEFEAFELGAGDFRVIAEFVQVLSH
jgi:hypothetical protein